MKSHIPRCNFVGKEWDTLVSDPNMEYVEVDGNMQITWIAESTTIGDLIGYGRFIRSLNHNELTIVPAEIKEKLKRSIKAEMIQYSAASITLYRLLQYQARMADASGKTSKILV